MIQSVQTLISFFGGVSLVAHYPAYDIAILLFHVAAIILLISPGFGKSKVIVLAVSKKALINELTAIVRIYSQKEEKAD